MHLVGSDTLHGPLNVPRWWTSREFSTLGCTGKTVLIISDNDPAAKAVIVCPYLFVCR